MAKIQRTFAKPKNQARRIMQADQAKPKDDKTRISSIGNRRDQEERLTCFAQWLMMTKRGTGLPQASVEDAMNWLNVLRNEGKSQSPLNISRVACQHLLCQTGKIKQSARLEKVFALCETIPEARAYTEKEVEAITERMNEKNALATQICLASGLRAHELLTLEPLTLDSRQPDLRYYDKAKTKLKNSPLKFTDETGHIHGVPYTVIGKGGLIRKIRIPEEIAAKLEARRLDTPITVVDRKIFYKDVRYDIGGGSKLSSAFSRASKMVLGHTGRTNHGIHGLRHTYAQRRFEALLKNPAIRTVGNALEIVSQELGHFRKCITYVYLLYPLHSA